MFQMFVFPSNRDQTGYLRVSNRGSFSSWQLPAALFKTPYHRVTLAQKCSVLIISIAFFPAFVSAIIIILSYAFSSAELSDTFLISIRHGGRAGHAGVGDVCAVRTAVPSAARVLAQPEQQMQLTLSGKNYLIFYINIFMCTCL